MLLGEPGIGKSTLLGVACRIDDGLVLRAAGAEQEMDLPLATLIQLLLPVRDRFDLVSDRHRHVLLAAIEHGDPAPPVSLGLAVLDLLGALAERHPLTVVVLDDVQWIDELSASALQFAIRRLVHERVATLLAARPDTTTRFDDVNTVEVVGIDADTCRSILSVGGRVNATVAEKARQACGGNPFVLGQLRAILTRGNERAPIHSLTSCRWDPHCRPCSRNGSTPSLNRREWPWRCSRPPGPGIADR